MQNGNIERAIFAAGCFWGVEHAFRQIAGVRDAISGYTGGHLENPTYEQVCISPTGHAEAVEVTFEPSNVSYDELLNAFWKMHDPTTLNRQGPDIGEQYRSAIFYVSEEQREAAERSREVRQESLSQPIVTEITEASQFWRAEDYHQRYFEKRGVAPHC